MSEQLDLDLDPVPFPPEGLPMDPEYREWLRSAGPDITADMKLIHAWARELRAAWLDGRPHGIYPEPRYRSLLESAALIAGIPLS